MLQVMIKHDAHKLSLAFGIPDMVEELERAVKKEISYTRQLCSWFT